MANIKYRDLDLDFKRHPITHDVSQKIDAEAVKRAVRNLILLQFSEKPFHPEINSSINSLLFESNVAQSGYLLKEYISQIIKDYEPRANNILVGISFNPDLNSISANIQFSVVNVPSIVQLNVPLVRSR